MVLVLRIVTVLHKTAYQVDLTMISLADNRKVWLGQKKIKKLVENGKVRY